MGTSTSVAQFAGKIAKAADAVKAAPKVAVKAAALSMKGDIEKSRNSAVGGDGRMSRVGKKGAKLGVGFKLADGGETASMRATGPWPLIESDIPKHKIVPKKKGSRRGIAFRGVVRASASHPGTKGKKPWRKGIDSGTPKAVKILRDQTIDAVRKAI
jgi:hypothetical protein